MSSTAILKLGIDVGSTTVKAVVVDNDQTVLWKRYERHNSKQPELVLDFIHDIQAAFPNTEFSAYITGSGGRAVGPHINARYIQEVNAVSYAVERMHPDAGSVVELGGQDAKVIMWHTGSNGEKISQTFMNDKCAGGTGATIDKIFEKIGLTITQAQRTTADGRTIHHIAAKCGVFAETDVVGLIKAGIDKEEVFISLCNAIVKQNLEVLVRGNVLKDTVILLGGPHTFLPVFSSLWRKELPLTWKLHGYTPSALDPEKLIFVPPDAQYYAAIGAVLFGTESEKMHAGTQEEKSVPAHILSGTCDLAHYINEGRLRRLDDYGATKPGLIQTEEELEKFRAEYAIPPFVNLSTNNSVIRGYIGIDGGSTSTKLALIDETGTLIYRDYFLSKGNPIDDVRILFASLKSWIAAHQMDVTILGTAVTGYASDILQQAFGFDLSIVETVAHMRSASALYGNVDIICDVGGQDIKVIFLKKGKVTDFKLNTQCSAGNGYFLQGMAAQFNIPVEEYAAYAFKARKAPAFNYGCAVFMEQDKVNFQQLGWSKEEIMAGLALVLPLNIWNYVVQETNIARLGRRMVLQGGTQKNLAAVKAQVDFIKSKVPDAEVFVHRYADIGGAIGAGLEIKRVRTENKNSSAEKGQFIGIDAACSIQYTAQNNESTRCKFCTNRCPRTIIDIHTGAGRKVHFITGYSCEKGMAEDVSSMKTGEKSRQDSLTRYPNLVAHAAESVFGLYPFEPYTGSDVSPSSKKERAAITVGIPRVLNNFYYSPFFSTYLRCLGIGKVVFSDVTDAKLWSEGNKWGAIDPCFPAKVAPAHIWNLIQHKNVTHICFPRITHLQSMVQNTLGNTACVIQMGTPEVIDAIFTRGKDVFKEKNISYWKPLVNLDKPREAEGLLYEYFHPLIHVTQEENAWAVIQAYKAMELYLNDLRERGRVILNSLVREDRIGILVIGHPYHHDPGLNHRILEEFQIRGFPILCIESLPADNDFLHSLFPEEKSSVQSSQAISSVDITDVWHRNFNRNTNLKIWGARIASRHPNLAVIDFSSFKCGHDAPTYSYIDNILDASGTPHFLFHDVDQNKPGATIKIRIKTIEYFLRQEESDLRARIKSLKG